VKKGRLNLNRETTKADLRYYLDDDKVRVTALKGLWGTGKTHLWEEIKGDLPPVNDNDHLYASCFGLESLDHIKAALFQNSLGKAEAAVTAAGKFSGFAIDVFEKVAAKVLPGAEGAASVMGSLGGLVQSALIDKVLHSRLIVLDDIERRASALQVDTLLGFIDLLKRNDCKVLLILNEEPLAEAQASGWRTLKEKCVDREITLLTSSAEAADIGLSADLPYREIVMDTLARLNVSNIRVIQRIDRIVKTIFGGVAHLPDAMVRSMLPATVVMTALNFNAVPKGPDVESLMQEWPAWCTRPGLFGNEEEMSDVVAFGVNAQLTRDVDFLTLVMQHVLTGHRLKEQFDALFQQRRAQDASNQAENAAIRYIEDTYLDPGLTNQDFIEKASIFKSGWTNISADKISAIASDLAARGAEALAEEIAVEWARRWRQSPRLWHSILHPLDNFYPVIKDAILAGNSSLSAKPSLVDAVMKVATGGWNPSDTAAINDATVKEVIDVIYALNREQFGSVVYFYRQEIKAPVQQAGIGSLFKKGTDTFVQAARQIVAENNRPRLTEMLKVHLGEKVFSASDAAGDETGADLQGIA